MSPATREWLAGLRGFCAERRQSQRPASAHDDAELAAEAAIIGTHLTTCLGSLEALLESRSDHDRTRGAAAKNAADPALVLTTSRAGLVSAARILEPGGDLARLVGERLAVVTEPEYRLWCIRCPDEAHRHHINLWSWVKTAVPPQRWPEFAAHPLAPDECYWLHRTGIAGAGTADRRDCHLWKWNGRHAALLQPFVREAVASRPDGSRRL